MLRIILYCDHWQNGGVESYLMNQLRHWDLSDIECTILTAEKTTDIYDDELKKLGVHQSVLLCGENASAILRIVHTFSRFEQYMKTHPCDVLYLNLTNSVTMRYAEIARKAGVKRRIVHSHCSGIQPGPTRFLKSVAHELAKKRYTRCATDWWACSDKAAEFLFTADVLPKVQYIPNAIEVKKFAFDPHARERVREELGIQKDDFLVGTVGRCTPEKNQAFLLEAFALAHRQNENMKLLIVGDGPLRGALEQQAKDLQIRQDCRFYGFTDDVAPLYSAMDLFCLPSVIEGFGIVALEAQANGCPCLLSSHITREADAGGHVRFLSIQDRLVWCSGMLTLSDRRERTENGSIAAQYDIVHAAERLQKELHPISK